MFLNSQRITSITDIDAICESSSVVFGCDSAHIHCKDLDGKYIASNDRVWRDAGFNKKEELFNKTDFDMTFLAENEAASFRKIDKLVMQSEKTHFFCQTLNLADGKKYIALNYKNALFSQSNKVVGVTSFGVVTLQLKSSFYDPCYPILNFLFASKVELANLLSKRQMACLYYLIAGFSIKRIAIKLKLSPKTVGNYVDIIKSKLDCSNRESLINFIHNVENH